MKITIDIDKLLEEGKISQAEYDKFIQFAVRGTTALAFNILIGFGVLAVSGSALALLPTPATAVVLGLITCAVGIMLLYARRKQWVVLANICILIGALLFGGGVIKGGDGSVGSFLLVAAAFAGGGIVARSSLLTVLSVLALSSCLGARTGYFHAAYFLGIKEPTLTIILFTLFSIGTYQLSKHVASNYRAIAMAASGTSVFLVNFGFWIGSLWGDSTEVGKLVIDGWFFAMLWAATLILAGVWGWKRNRRWLVNVVAVFGGIHFYTQWFEHLGASAETVLVAGLLALSFAVTLRTVNVKLSKAA